jgi:hypothetical protein
MKLDIRPEARARQKIDRAIGKAIRFCIKSWPQTMIWMIWITAAIFLSIFPSVKLAVIIFLTVVIASTFLSCFAAIIEGRRENRLTKGQIEELFDKCNFDENEDGEAADGYLQALADVMRTDINDALAESENRRNLKLFKEEVARKIERIRGFPVYRGDYRDFQKAVDDFIAGKK